MSTLSVTNINTSNGTTDLTIKTGNTSGPVLLIGAGSNISITNTTNLLLGSNVNITPSSLTVGNSTVNGSITTSALFVGNSTVNAVITQNTLRIGNSSVGITFAANGNVGLGGNSTPTVELYVNGSAAGAIGTLVDGANIAVDLAAFNNYSVTLNGNRNIDNPTGLVAGQSGVIYLSQNSTGGQAPTWGSYWKFPGNTAPTLTTSASAVDAVVYSVRTTTSITAQAILNVG